MRELFRIGGVLCLMLAIQLSSEAFAVTPPPGLRVMLAMEAPSGQLQEWTPPGLNLDTWYKTPDGTSIDSIAMYRGRVYFANESDQRIFYLDPSGDAQVYYQSHPKEARNVHGLAFDSTGQLHFSVVKLTGGMIYKVVNGKALKAYDVPPSTLGMWSGAFAFAPDGNDTLYIAANSAARSYIHRHAGGAKFVPVLEMETAMPIRGFAFLPDHERVLYFTDGPRVFHLDVLRGGVPSVATYLGRRVAEDIAFFECMAIDVGQPCGVGGDCSDPGLCDDKGVCHVSYELAGTPCGEPEDCRFGSCDSQGGCRFKNRADGFGCTDKDSDPCTEAQCDGMGSCDQTRPADAGKSCADKDENECTEAQCDGLGTCDQAHPADTGKSCADKDENECTEAQCDGMGTCDQNHPVVPSDCNPEQCDEGDGNECTYALCNGEGACEPAPEKRPWILPCGNWKTSDCYLEFSDKCEDGVGKWPPKYWPPTYCCDPPDVCDENDVCQPHVKPDCSPCATGPAAEGNCYYAHAFCKGGVCLCLPPGPNNECLPWEEPPP